MKKISLFFLLLFSTIGVALAQQKIVSGVVISAEDNEPVIGASVVAKGFSGIGAQTDLNGKFQFSAPAGAKVIVVSYMGMQTQEVTIRPNMRIILKNDAIALDDVVIVGYGSGKKIANTTASIVKIGATTLSEKPIANPFDAVQGKVAGLQVFNSSGAPGELSSIRLHGRGSLGAGATPLYVLDGVPTTAGTIMSMNPNDFESMQFLKDASATSIYGSRAANGVVYVKTKRGMASDRANITVRGMYGISRLANEDYFKAIMTADELAKFWVETGIKTQEYVNQLRTDYPNDTRWYKYFYRDNAPTYSADMSISGGSGSTNYYLSGSVSDQQGLRRNKSSYSRYNFRANLNTRLNPYIRLSLNQSLSYDITKYNTAKGNSFDGGLGPQILPFYSPYDKEGKEYFDEKIPGLNDYSQSYSNAKITYPKNTFDSHTTMNAIITPIKNLTLSSTAAMGLSDYDATWLRYPSYNNSGNGKKDKFYSRDVTWTFSNTVEYKTNLDEHHMTLLGGHEFMRYDYTGFGASGTGLSDDRMVLLGNVTKDKEVRESYSHYAFLSFFGRLSYDYAQKYFLDLTLRNDASSRFPKSNRNAQFWSVGSMWKAKQEAFLKDISWLNQANIKFSTGTSGNASIGNYEFWSLAGKINQYEASDGWGIKDCGNDKLSWEKQLKTTLGFDFRFFDRLNVNLEFYNRLTTSMLMSVPNPYTTGFSSLNQNVGKYRNRGVDLHLDFDILKNKSGDYLAANFTFNYNQDKILELFQGLNKWIIPGTGICYRVGAPVTFFYPLFNRINPDNGEPEWFVPGEDNSIKTQDPNNVTNTFNSNLEQNTGIRRYAPITGGFGLEGNFKGFYAQADFAFVLGKYMISNDNFFYENPITRAHVAPRRTVADYWKQPGDKARFPGIKPGRRFTEFDSRLLQNASFMRMKNLTIGYRVPKSIISKQNFITGAKIYFTGRNLLTFTKFEGPDPEVDSNLALGPNPNTKQFSMGLELKF